MKQLMKGYVYYIKYDFAPEPKLQWSASATMGKADPDWVLVGQHDFEVECPDDFDPRPLQVAAIDDKLADLRAEFGKRVAELQEQKNRLLCLEMA
jgi:hypothetical protein